MASEKKKPALASERSPLRAAVVAVLLEGPGHGYDVARRLRMWVGPSWRIYAKHLYPVLKSLERDEYDADGDRTKMVDGTGTTTYTYDQLDRPTETKDGHGNVVKYEYDLANNETKITYPNGKSVTRVFDKDGRLEKVTDWLEHLSKFGYNQDSQLNVTTFPTATGDVDKYSYNDADQMSEIKMAKGAETLASLAYTRDSVGQIKKTTSKSLPGAEIIENTYDENSRLTKGGTVEYKYDAANNPTKTGSSTNTYNEGDELEKGTGITYSYDEVGERTKTSPSSGPATTFGYDEAGNLTSVERPKEGEFAKIEDSYAYNGDGLRTSQTISGTTGYLAWDMAESLPLILNDGTNSYIYGAGGLPVEQVSSEGTVTYLHHDQQSSTRLLTGSTGTATGSTTFDAYGNKTGSTGTVTTPLGYDGQYTSSDTGLTYLRARVYDPATAQFITTDPIAGLTLAPYSYVNDNPANYNDPRGLIFGIPGTPSISEIAGTVASGAESAVGALNTAAKAVSGAAHYAAPAIDAVAAGACIAAAEVCGAAIVGNFFLQQILAADQAVYNPNYPLGENEAAIFVGAGLGSLGVAAADAAGIIEQLGYAGGLDAYGRLALGGAVGSPEWILSAAQFLSPEEVQAALLACQ